MLIAQLDDLCYSYLYFCVEVCPDGELQCANGECLSVEFFCDKKPDCADGRLVSSMFF